MPAPAPDARTQSAELVGNVPCGDDGVLLSVRPAEELPPVRASRFFMLKRADRVSPLIPRPFSIYRQEGDRVEFLVKVMGRGTRALAEARPGQELILTGPLGNGWPTLDGDGAPWVLLAGGVGVAPFHLAIQQALAGMDGATPVGPGAIHLLEDKGFRGSPLRAGGLASAGWAAGRGRSVGVRGSGGPLAPPVRAGERPIRRRGGARHGASPRPHPASPAPSLFPALEPQLELWRGPRRGRSRSVAGELQVLEDAHDHLALRDQRDPSAPRATTAALQDIHTEGACFILHLLQ